ncbi:MAG TPA: enoyl-CoA hydratase-related protein, partial [Novosphingobium sp.]|nr:enoyl-CoA hydratase-related protein [Novosphingobium sp.]
AAVDEELVITIAHGIARATINRPYSRNAISSQIIQQLLELLARMRTDPSIRVLLLDAAGENFIAGGDVKAFARGLEMTVTERSQDMAERAARAGALCLAISEVPQPVVVAARGFVVGVGMSILCAADLAILSETARLMLSHVSLGISPDGGASWSLPRQIGMKRAKQLALLGDRIDADQACAMGLANWVVPDAELDASALALAERIAAGARVAQAQTKALVQASFARDFAGQVEAEVTALAHCATTPDYAEGLRAITGKRPARFGGEG